MRIIKIMKLFNFMKNNSNNENHRFPLENHENHENHIIPNENYENHGKT